MSASIQLDQAGKRFNSSWIFKNVTYTFDAINAYVLLGANGSGKSTFLQMIAGYLMASAGTIQYSIRGKAIGDDQIFKQVSLAAPYLDLIDSFTIGELVDFHFKFKSFVKGVSPDNFLDILQLDRVKNKPLKTFSSGMRQRVKLALAILSDTPILLLDEPTSNLDHPSIDWYNNLIASHRADRLILVCSNSQKHEYSFCNIELSMENYK